MEGVMKSCCGCKIGVSLILVSFLKVSNFFFGRSSNDLGSGFGLC